ncbi:MAG TPA: hypothetical protein VFT34_13550 [Verrucomicrobiae bacterium]|nr:hypothetical protein [Verrucomicrobiae bacterium]
MRIFYADYRTSENVSCDAAVELSFSESRRILNRIVSGRGFIGVILHSGVTLQFYQDDSELSVEMVDSNARRIDQAKINLPLAESALEAAFGGGDVRAKLNESFVKWERSVIPD